MEFIAFPIRIGPRGKLACSGSHEESIIRLLNIMAYTPRAGWCGSEDFGLRDVLAGLQSKHGAHLAAIKQMNQALQDLEIDWVKVIHIEAEPTDQPGSTAYLLTLTYADRGTEVHRIKV